MPQQKRYLTIFIWLSLSIYSSFGWTETVKKQSIPELYEKASEHFKQKVDQKLHAPKITLKKVSSKLRLQQCETPLELIDSAPNRYYGRMSIQFRCNKPFWKLYMTAMIDGYLPVVVSTQGILRQAVIKEADIEKVFLPYKQVKKNYFIDPQRVIGMRAKRAIGPNVPISVQMVQPPFLVFRGQKVRIVARIGSLKVESVGTALEDGIQGQQVDIRNNSSKRIIKGIVVAPNLVEVP